MVEYAKRKMFVNVSQRSQFYGPLNLTQKISSVWRKLHTMTGYEGSDCSMPICVQGFYDPTCVGIDASQGGQAVIGVQLRKLHGPRLLHLCRGLGGI